MATKKETKPVEVITQNEVQAEEVKVEKPKQTKAKKEPKKVEPELRPFRKLTREEKMKYLTGKWD